ncbi:MAG: hypothetical protein FJ264_07915 [Planctomycetes bacterium]|nr:hypothetical protein [Planctomycetota bacterium]
MHDTHPEIELKFKELMMKKTPEERLKMGCSMFGFAKAIIQSSIQQNRENITSSELKEKLFSRLYAKEMDESKKEKITAYFSNLESKNYGSNQKRYER